MSSTSYNWEESTDIYWTCEELFGYSDDWSNNVGGCQSHFYGVCSYESEEQEIPCIFCRIHNGADDEK